MKTRKGGVNAEETKKREDRQVCNDPVRDKTSQYDGYNHQKKRFESKASCAVTTITCLAAENIVQLQPARVQFTRAAVQLLVQLCNYLAQP
jgi:hypothetical protein